MDDAILYRLFLQEGWWQTSRSVAELYDDFETAGVFAELVSTRHLSEKKGILVDDWFTTTYTEMAKSTFISENKIGQCIRAFMKDELLETKRVGIPSKCFYRLNMQNLIRALESTAKRSSTDSSRTRPTETCHVKDKEEKSKEEDDKGKDSLSSKEPTDVDSPKVVIKRRTVQPSLFPNDNVKRLFLHWNNLGSHIAKHLLDPSTKIFHRSVLAIEKALRHNTPDNIASAMDNYSNLLADQNTTMFWPTQSGRPGLIVSLEEFFKFSDYTEERMLKAKEVNIPDSWYKCCLQDYDIIATEYGKYDRDDNPKITEAIKKAYTSAVPAAKITVTDTNFFIRSAKFVLQYHMTNKNKINWNSCLLEKNNPALFAHRLIAAILEDCQDRTMITSSWLFSDRTKTIRLPKYMKKHGLLTSDEITYKAPIRPLQTKKKGYDPGYKDGEIE
jgi:hypothetical protein